jgi:hypothetical protein
MCRGAANGATVNLPVVTARVMMRGELPCAVGRMAGACLVTRPSLRHAMPGVQSCERRRWACPSRAAALAVRSAHGVPRDVMQRVVLSENVAGLLADAV